MSQNFVIWDSAESPDACVLQSFAGVDDDWEIAEGIPRAVGWPSDAMLTMDPDYPHDTRLVDNVINVQMLIVASPALRSFLELQQLAKVEYLPVSIVNHKGRIASSDYCIVHPVASCDCLDLDECGIEWDEMDEETIDTIDEIVLDESKIDRRMFRVKYLEGVILVDRDLARAIDAQGFEGIEWVELEDYES